MKNFKNVILSAKREESQILRQQAPQDDGKVLAIDLGNTTISFALFQKTKLLSSGFVKNGNIPQLIKKIRNKGGSTVGNAIITSVVPIKEQKLKLLLKRSFKGIKIWTIGKNVLLKMKMHYQKRLLGSDRLVNLYGAIRKYQYPLLVIDYGTAITFDYVSKKGIFMGGLIVPGIETAWKALQERAALLPRLPKLREIHTLATTNTKSAMFSGLLNGFGALSDGLISRFKHQYGRNLKVLATGGSSRLISRYASEFDIIDPLHTLRSLNQIFLEIS